MLQDLKFALHAFRRNPGFAAIAIVAIALAHSRRIVRMRDGRILSERVTERL
jgi:hypothetical protein